MPVDQDPDREELGRLLEEWFLRTERGESPDVGELAAHRPDLHSRLTRLIERERALFGDAPASREDPLLGTKLGDYRVVRLLGAGGMGRVYVAEDERLGRPAALKVVAPGIARDPTARLRFRREAEITATLDHPNIVPVYATGDDDGHLWLAMKLLDGPSLDRLDARLPARAIAGLLASVARALAAAHGALVVHRDVKPANVILHDGRPYVVDFGLARLPDASGMTSEGAVPGTLHYLAPDLLTGHAQPADPRADLWALGATLYELAAGRPPFVAPTTEALIRRILADDPAPLSAEARRSGLEAIAFKALEKRPEQRYPTAEALAEDLERCASGEAVAARRVGPVRRLARRLRRYPVATGVVLVALLVATMAVGRQLARVRHEAELFRQGLEDARRVVVVDDDPLEGRRRLGVLRTLHGPREELLALEREATARLALEALLDHVVAPIELQDRARGVRKRETLLRAEPALAESPRGRLALAAFALADGRLDDIPGLLSGSDAARRFPRGTKTLLALAGREAPATVAAAVESVRAADPKDGVEDAVFAAIGFALVEAPLPVQRREIDLALSLRPDDYRANVCRAAQLEAAGDLVAAEATYRLLLRHEAHRPVVLCGLARVALAEGDLARARLELERADAAMAALSDTDPDWSITAIRCAVLLRGGDTASLSAVLERARLDFAERSWLALIEGFVALEGGDAAAARARFETAAAISAQPRPKRRAAVARLSLDVAEVLGSRLGELDEVRAAARPILAGIRPVLDDALEHDDRAAAATLLALRSRLEAVVGRDRSTRPWELLENALALHPPSATANAEFVLRMRHTLAPLLDDPPFEAAGSLRDVVVRFAEDACRRADLVTRASGASWDCCDKATLVAVLAAGYDLARALEREELATTLARRAMALRGAAAAALDAGTWARLEAAAR